MTPITEGWEKRFKKEVITIYLARNGMKGLIKGQAIMREIPPNISYPIAYIKKAKGATDKEYWDILDGLFQCLTCGNIKLLK
jgi:hypothetical protein